jgi:hypothetical protein
MNSAVNSILPDLGNRLDKKEDVSRFEIVETAG